MNRFVACFVLFAAVLRGATAPLSLVPGHPLPIVVSPGAGQTEQFAAAELARYLSHITGQPFAVHPAGADMPGEAILVGRTLAESLGESFSRDRFGDDGILLKRSGNRILIAGIAERGTLYAVYAFLERLGCGFYAPNFEFYGAAGGEHIPHLADLAVGDLDVVVKPSFSWRMKYVEEVETDTLERLLALVVWMPKLGFL